uniref:Uncharacterized protein n=1 Tax=Streptomyces sp. NBC_00003 TaxID=2903608 RepID=A0AAU2UZI7_9ACTN
MKARGDAERFDAVTTYDAADYQLLYFVGDRAWSTAGPGVESENVVPFNLEHLPGEFRSDPGAAASAVLDQEEHYFLAKGTQFVIVTADKHPIHAEANLLQGPTQFTDACPFLTGPWMPPCETEAG